MILDKQNTFSEAQAVTATADSTNILNAGGPGVNTGNPVEVLCEVEDDFTAAGAATLTVSLVTSVDEAFTSPVTLLTTPAIPKATLVRGYQFAIGFLPPGVLQFTKLVYTVATGPMTAGKINAGIVLARQTNKKYP